MNAISLPEPSVTVAEAARQLSLTDGRIRQLLRAGQLHGRHLSERLWVIPVSELERFSQARQAKNR